VVKAEVVEAVVAEAEAVLAEALEEGGNP